MTNIYFSFSVTRLLFPAIRTHGTRIAVERNSLKKNKENKNVFTEKLVDVNNRIFLLKGRKMEVFCKCQVIYELVWGWDVG